MTWTGVVWEGYDTDGGLVAIVHDNSNPPNCQWLLYRQTGLWTGVWYKTTGLTPVGAYPADPSNPPDDSTATYTVF